MYAFLKKVCILLWMKLGDHKFLHLINSFSFVKFWKIILKMNPVHYGRTGLVFENQDWFLRIFFEEKKNTTKSFTLVTLLSDFHSEKNGLGRMEWKVQSTSWLIKPWAICLGISHGPTAADGGTVCLRLKGVVCQVFNFQPYCTKES